MKTLSPKPGGKGGGKIHPSPVEDPIRAAFRLLPAAILVLVAGLGPEDREVLAYFVATPVEGGLPNPRDAAVPPSEHPPARGGGRGGGRRRAGCAAPAPCCAGHPPTHGCGCFECYISFWARWNRSPQRDRILDAVEAFEEHLAAIAKAAASPPSPYRRRERGRRSRVHAAPPPPPAPLPLRRSKSPEPQVVEATEQPASPPPPSYLPPPPEAPAASTAEEEEKGVPEPAAAAEPEPEECRDVAAVSGEEDRKRGWAGVMGGVLGLRLWGIWSPAVESAT